MSQNINFDLRKNTGNSNPNPNPNSNLQRKTDE